MKKEAKITTEDENNKEEEDVEQTGLFAMRNWIVLVVSGIYHRLSFFIWRLAFFLIIPDPDKNIAAERDLLRDKVMAAVQNKDSTVSNHDETTNNNNNKDTTAASTYEHELLQSVMAERDALRYKVDEYKIREEEYKLREVEYVLREERLRKQIVELHELNIKQLID
jgi:hypothetical protein